MWPWRVRRRHLVSLVLLVRATDRFLDEPESENDLAAVMESSKLAAVEGEEDPSEEEDLVPVVME